MRFDVDTITAVSTAIGAIIGAGTAFVVALRPILAELKKNTRATIEAAEVGRETHAMVNSQREAAEAQQTRSDNAMREAGVPIPINPAVRVQASDSDV